MANDPTQPVTLKAASAPGAGRGVSPMASGPAGASLEAHVGAQYLLPLLQSGEPRGMPGMVVRQVQFQRGDLGSPMDDVIVRGHDGKGDDASLQIQVKRTIEFTAGDSEFKSVVAMACQAAVASGAGNHSFAVATGGAPRMERHVQTVLQWARDYQDPSEFFRRLARKGAAHQNMRDFVAAFASHMKVAGAPYDDTAVHQLLRRFLVLVFDAQQPGSLSNTLARDRCAALLSVHQLDRASPLWETLGQTALALAAVGGDMNSAQLRSRLGEQGFELVGDRRLRQARERIAQDAALILERISTMVHGIRLDREPFVSACSDALAQGRYLELRGAAGVGKSGVLKALANQLQMQSRVIVLAPYSVPGGGWTAMQNHLGISASPEEFLTDFAGDGGATLFIDGIDRFESPAERITVQDLLVGAAKTHNFRVVATTRQDFDEQASAWLPQGALQTLGRAPSVVIDKLTQDEVDLLREESPALMALLRPDHPAQLLVQNLYRLDWLSRSPPQPGQAYSEAQMAFQWWKTVDLDAPQGRVELQRVLRSMAVSGLASSAPADTSVHPASALERLAGQHTVRQVRIDRYEFTHDILRDWAVGCLLYDEPERVADLVLGEPVPLRLTRAVELAARLHVERHEDSAGWRSLLQTVSAPGSHGSWKRLVLLALCRSERALDSLTKCAPLLFADEAALLRDTMRLAVAIDSRPAAELWAGYGPELIDALRDVQVPDGPSWQGLVMWTLGVAEFLPHAAVPEVIELYRLWCMGLLGRDPLSALVVKQLHRWLVEVESIKHPADATFRQRRVAAEKPGLFLGTSDEHTLRQTFLSWCVLQPDLAEAYLRSLVDHPHNESIMRELVQFTGTAARAAPQSLADLFFAALTQNDSDKDESRRTEAFAHWTYLYNPASQTRAPFLDLLRAAPGCGLALVRSILDYCIARVTGGQAPDPQECLVVPLPEGPRTFPWRDSYFWPRQSNWDVVTSALMALETWAQERMDAGEPIEPVLQDIIGPEGSPAAYVLVAVDVMLSHWPASRDVLWPFAASAELVAMDRQRMGIQAPNLASLGGLGSNATLDTAAEKRNSRLSRRMSLEVAFDLYAWYGTPEQREAMRAVLAEQMQVMGPPDPDRSTASDPRLVAFRAFHRLDTGNYRRGETGPDGVEMPAEYVPPAAEEAVLRKIRERTELRLEQTSVVMHLVSAMDEGAISEAALIRGLELLADKTLDAGHADERNPWRLAALVLRDGSDALREEHGPWAREALSQAATQDLKHTHPGSLVTFNAWAIAATGLLADVTRGGRQSLQPLLALAVQDRTRMHGVLWSCSKNGRPVRPNLSRALMRLGIASEVYARRQGISYAPGEDWQARQQEFDDRRDEANRANARDAVAAELSWLAGMSPEPGWPKLPASKPPKKRKLADVQARGRRRDQDVVVFDFDSAGCAHWIELAAHWWSGSDAALLRSLLLHGWPWTAAANGIGMAQDEEAGERAHEWTRAYFSACVRAAATLRGAAWQELVFGPLLQLPEKAFLDAVEYLLLQIDALWLDEARLADEQVLMVRQAVANRLRLTMSWKWLAARPSHNIDRELGGALARVFLCTHDLLRRSLRCHLPRGKGRHSTMLMPVLTSLVQEGAGSTFVAMAFLELIEVAPTLDNLTFFWSAISAWKQQHGADAGFWKDHGVGKRACAWTSAVIFQPDGKFQNHRDSLIGICDTLLVCGIAEAKPLEQRVLQLFAN